MFVIVTLGPHAHGGVLINASLTNPTMGFSDVTFDIEATFTAPQTGDFIRSLTLELNISSDLLAASPSDPYERFSVATAGSWIVFFDAINGRVFLDASEVSGFPPVPIDPLVDGVTQTLARLRVNTTGLLPNTYIISLDSSNNSAIGTVNGSENFDVDHNSILVDDNSFTITGILAVPEPASIFVLGFCAVPMLLNRRRRQAN